MAVSLGLILDTTRQGLPALAARRAELERAAAEAPPPVGFARALRRPTLGLVAEVKRRSPSAGSINATLDPVARAVGYASAGAAAISVLTDGPFFGGSLDDLRAVVAAVAVPVLRKDFILAEEQLLEARAAGASAALLIVRALGAARLASLARTARDLGLDTLVEVHTAAELDVAVAAGADVIGVNSRDLDTFRIDIDAAWRLLACVPSDRLAVAESGMASVADAERAAAAGADAVLVGTALSAAADPMALAAGIAGLVRRGR
jgi:indole-3-glycerol phosphate synthase